MFNFGSFAKKIEKVTRLNGFPPKTCGNDDIRIYQIL
jgi:hypothetical protein